MASMYAELLKAMQPLQKSMELHRQMVTPLLEMQKSLEPMLRFQRQLMDSPIAQMQRSLERQMVTPLLEMQKSLEPLLRFQRQIES